MTNPAKKGGFFAAITSSFSNFGSAVHSRVTRYNHIPYVISDLLPRVEGFASSFKEKHSKDRMCWHVEQIYQFSGVQLIDRRRIITFAIHALSDKINYSGLLLLRWFGIFSASTTFVWLRVMCLWDLALR